MMPKHSLSARLLTALLAVSTFTLAACDSGDGGTPGGTSVAVVTIVTVPNAQTLTNLVPAATRQMLGVPTNEAGNWVDKDVTYASSNNAVFTVSAGGLVTAVAGGTAYLRASAGGRIDSVAIGVRFPVATVTVSNAGLVLRREGTQQLTTTLIDTQGATVTGRTVTWSSDTPANVTVSATGLAAGTLAVDNSTATITATVNNAADGAANVAGTRLITVVGDPAIATITLTGFQGNSFYGDAGANFTPTATARSGVGTVIGAAVFAWTSSSGATATINGATGEIDLQAAGTTNISATAPAYPGGPNVVATRAIEVAPQLAAGANAIAVPSGTTVSYAVYAPAGTDSIKFVMVHADGDGDIAIFGPSTATWAWNTTTGPNTNFTQLGGDQFSYSAGGSDENIFITKGAFDGAFGGPGFYRLAVHAWTGTGFTVDVDATGTLSFFP